MEQTLEDRLIVGAKIKIGPLYAAKFGYEPGEILDLVEGYFDKDNGIATETETAPSIWDKDDEDFSSIYHLFGNDLEDFMDCAIV